MRSAHHADGRRADELERLAEDSVGADPAFTGRREVDWPCAACGEGEGGENGCDGSHGASTVGGSIPWRN